MTITVPNQGNTTQADTSATPNTIPLRDSAGGITHTTVTATTAVKAPVLNGTPQSKTANFTIDGTGNEWLVDATAGAVTVTLPAATSGNAGQVHHVYKVDSSGNNVTLSGVSGTTTISTQWHMLRIVSTGSAWIAA